jgi:hypothetical protein
MRRHRLPALGAHTWPAQRRPNRPDEQGRAVVLDPDAVRRVALLMEHARRIAVRVGDEQVQRERLRGAAGIPRGNLLLAAAARPRTALGAAGAFRRRAPTRSGPYAAARDASAAAATASMSARSFSA